MTRVRALSLFRRILRAQRNWTGPAKEKTYILNEARSQFRQNRGLSDEQKIAEKLFEGESRLEMALHYGIPYPRLHHKLSTHRYLNVPETRFGKH